MDNKEKIVAAMALVLTIMLAYVCAGYIREMRGEHALAQNEAVQESPAAPQTPDCVSDASLNYQVPLSVLMAIMRVEGGHVGQAVHNLDGSFDLGLMQINSLWIPQLAQMWGVDYGTAYGWVRDNACENIYIGAWILKQKIDQTGSLYNGIAAYHSANRTLGVPYANKVISLMWVANGSVAQR